MDRICEICKRDTVNRQVTTTGFIQADGMLKTIMVCLECVSGRKMRCPKDNEIYIVFIDGTHCCPVCVEQKAKIELAKNLGKVTSDYESVCLGIDDKDEFLTLVRAATAVPNLAEELCWLFAVYAAAERLGLKPSYVIIKTKRLVKKNRSLVASLLPVSPPK